MVELGSLVEERICETNFRKAGETGEDGWTLRIMSMSAKQILEA